VSQEVTACSSHAPPCAHVRMWKHASALASRESWHQSWHGSSPPLFSALLPCVAAADAAGGPTRRAARATGFSGHLGFHDGDDPKRARGPGLAGSVAARFCGGRPQPGRCVPASGAGGCGRRLLATAATFAFLPSHHRCIETIQSCRAVGEPPLRCHRSTASPPRGRSEVALTLPTPRCC